MIHNPPSAFRHPHRNRGSILIFVIALLTLIALVGTALVATSRVDRATSQIHVQDVSLTATRNQYQDLLYQKTTTAIRNGFGHDVDSARTDPWLGDRLPLEFPGVTPPYAPGSKVNISPLPWPMWRFASGILDPYDPDLRKKEAWQPPHQYNPTNPETLFDPFSAATIANSAVKYDAANLGLALVPHHLSITYPLDHPEESMRGKTRTFPAAYFTQRNGTPGPAPFDAANNHDVNSARPFLAADADGDGIADSILFRLSPSAVDGVTYFGAVRVIDNNSAINVNTAALRTSDIAGNAANPLILNNSTGLNTAALLDPTAAAYTGSNNGFFTSDIGLYELLDPYNGYHKRDGTTPEGNARPARDNELAELLEYRLGYPNTNIDSTNDLGGWVDAFEDYSNPGINAPSVRNTGTYPNIRPMFASLNNGAVSTVNNNLLVAIEDRAQDPGDIANASNTWNPDPDNSNSNDTIGNYSPLDTSAKSRVRPDFTFATQNEAFDTMAARRWESIRFGSDLRLTLDQSATALSTVAARDAIFPTASPENIDKTVGDFLYNFRSATDTRSQAEHALFPYRWLDEQEAGSLAYHFLLINPRGTQSAVDSIFRHSAYRSAPNWKPELADTNPTWSSFPSNEYQYWFQYLNFDANVALYPPPATYTGADPVTGAAYPTDIAFIERPSFADLRLVATGTSLTTTESTLPRFRPIRTLLTTHNPVNTSYIATDYLHANNQAFTQASTVGRAFTGIDWNRDETGAAAKETSLVYPGMILNDMLNRSAGKYRVPEPWQAGTQYALNDLVYLPASRITYMCIKDFVGSQGVDPSSAANFDPITGEPLYWEPQQWVSGHTKASVNTAGFPELWRGYFNVTATSFDSGTTTNTALRNEIDALATATSIPAPNKLASDDYSFFPSTVSDPLGAAPVLTKLNDPDGLYLRYYDPYRGMRFRITDTVGRDVDPATGLPTATGADPTFDPAIANAPEVNNYLTVNPTYEHNALGMFRSVIRDPATVRPLVNSPTDTANPDEYLAPADASKTFTNSATILATIKGDATHSPQERLTPFQMATLRSAIAAFNTQDMLNVYGLMENGQSPGTYNINDIPAKTIILYDTTRELPNPNPNTGTRANGTGTNEATTNYPGPDSPRPQYEVTIYGNRPQLFISEVFANNDTYRYDFPDPLDTDAMNKPALKEYWNPNGYIAIELYNPYPVAVDTTGWKISSINRNSSGAIATFGTTAHRLGGTGGATDITFASLGIPTSIPAGARIIIESYNSLPDTTNNSNVKLNPSDPSTAPYATRQYRPPATGMKPLWDRLADDTQEDDLWLANKTSPTLPASGYPKDVAAGTLDPSNHANFIDYSTIGVGRYSSAALTTFLTSNEKELIILRPRKVGVVPTNKEEMVPVDQFDFTGMPVNSTGPCQSIHYARNTSNQWDVVYPGRYDGGRGDYQAGGNLPIGPRRHQGTWVTPGPARSYTPPAQDPWISPKYTTSVPFSPFDASGTGTQKYGAMSFGLLNSRDGASAGSIISLSTITFSNAPVGGPQVFQNIAIPLLGYPIANNPLITSAAVAQNKIQHPAAQTINQFPFGGFARNGDILQVPFIAAYRIRKFQSTVDSDVPTSASGVAGVNPGHLDPPYTFIDAGGNTVGNILEMNSISMDAAFAEDTDPLNDVAAPPVDTVASGAKPVAVESVGRLSPRASQATPNAYSFASNLFRYLDVHVPASDYLPDTNPAIYPPGSPLTNAAFNTKQLAKPVNNRPGTPNLSIDPGSTVANQAALQATLPTNEDSVATQGLINLNTAPRKVLSMLPLVPLASGVIDVANTQAAAKSIFDYVSGTADIKNLFELNNIPGIQGKVPYSADFHKLGDPYPVYSGAAGTTAPDPNIGNLKQQYLLMNRISNLVTTKSDTFTVYLLVQGWRESGTQFPVLDWEQRQAYTVDRSTGTLRVTKVPTD